MHACIHRPPEDTPEAVAWDKMKKRAEVIRINAKVEKKAVEMKTELLTLKRTIKDLESASEGYLCTHALQMR
jgi:thiamine biosynthesis lipoprotein ApbE